MISVICPVFNESSYIKKVIDFYINALPIEKELFVIDGNSTDNTCEIVKQYIIKNTTIHLLHNPKRTVPYALNMAIEKAKGEIIIRLDAHTDYASDYFEKILSVFKNTNADIVGGPMRIAKGNTIQNAIGYATTTVFGIGNSSFHFEDFEGFTDSVYLGAWKKNIFSKTGLFDVDLKRNQDDEFHYRAKSFGFKVYQHPEIKLYYHPRDTFYSLFKQYYQYGLYKPLVLKKIKSAMRLRHLVPSIFVLYLISLCVLFFIPFYYAIIPFLFYIIGDLYFSLRSKKELSEILAISVVYPILHISYGIGFMLGLTKKRVQK
ncbi:MAG TPA: glycosyltransferase family 2 protein [Bacteroidia bacterium]|nr:glycosyltransferase family 2 protein [Bacteroidia bacterium]